MPELVAPTVVVQRSFLAAVVEYQREGRYTDLDPVALGQPAVFRAYLDALAAEALPETPRRPGIVAQTTLWWTDAECFLGRLSIRHQLTDTLRQVGGHIGYDVRPCARGQGHATSMLRAGLGVAGRMGIDPALITCDHTNVASRKAIEHNGGLLWQTGGGKLRFWVPHAAPPDDTRQSSMLDSGAPVSRGGESGRPEWTESGYWRRADGPESAPTLRADR